MTQDHAPERVPIVEERLKVSKQEVQTGVVRIRTVVREEREPVEMTLSETQAEVRRVAVDRLVDAPVADRQEGDTTIISLHREVLVPRLQVYEEIHVVRQHRTEVHRETVTLRREDVAIERLDPPTAPAAER